MDESEGLTPAMSAGGRVRAQLLLDRDTLS